MYPHALIRGNPLSTTYIRLLRNKLSLVSSITISIPHFLEGQGRTTEQGEGKACILIPCEKRSNPKPFPHPNTLLPHHPIYHLSHRPWQAPHSRIVLYSASPTHTVERSFYVLFDDKCFLSGQTLTLIIPFAISANSSLFVIPPPYLVRWRLKMYDVEDAQW